MTKCLRQDVGKVVLKCTSAISITEVKKHCNLKKPLIYSPGYNPATCWILKIRCSWFQTVITLGSHYSKINFVGKKNADVHTKATLFLWQ